MRKIIALLILVASSACGGGSPSHPTAPTSVVVAPQPTINLSGGWFGSWSSATLGYGPATLSIIQNGIQLSGNWSVTDQSRVVTSGTIQGSVTNVNSIASGDVSMTMIPSDPRQCRFQFTGTGSTNIRSIFGQFVTTNCTVSASGTLIVDR